jgi:hypothetical protein
VIDLIAGCWRPGDTIAEGIWRPGGRAVGPAGRTALEVAGFSVQDHIIRRPAGDNACRIAP